MNKASGGDGIPIELFQILKVDAIKVLHSICQQTYQWPQDWKRSVFIPTQKKDNVKECSNYCIIFSIKSFPLEVCVHSVFLRIHGWHGTSPSFCIRISACIHKLLEGFFVFRYHFQRAVSLHFFQSYSAFMPLPNLLRQLLDFPVEKSTGHFSVLILLSFWYIKVYYSALLETYQPLIS